MDDDADQNERFDAIVESLDTELGRMFDGMGGELLDRTTIIALGDNGTPGHATDPPLDPERVKHTVFEGGVHVPFIIAGPHVAAPGSVSDALVHVADVAPTVMQLAGVPLGGPDQALQVDVPAPVPLDGRSLVPLMRDPSKGGHDMLYVEAYFPHGPGPDYNFDLRAMRNDRFKVVDNNGDRMLFDLEGQVIESEPIAPESSEQAQTAWEELTAELDRLAETMAFEGF